MPDEPNLTPPPQTTLANDPAARTETGEIKDVTATTASTAPDQKSETTEKSSTSEVSKGDKDGTLAAKAGEDKKPDAPVVPDKYEFKAPEGMTIDTKLVDEATPMFKELGLTQDQAQKLFDFYVKNTGDAAQKAIDQYNEMRDGWRKEIVADKTIGNGKDGLAPQTQQNISAAIAALPADVAAAFRDAMNLTGAGDNPAFIRAMNAFGEAFREGTPVKGANPSPLGQKAPNSGPPTAAQALYPKLPSSAS